METLEILQRAFYKANLMTAIYQTLIKRKMLNKVLGDLVKKLFYTLTGHFNRNTSTPAHLRNY